MLARQEFHVEQALEITAIDKSAVVETWHTISQFVDMAVTKQQPMLVTNEYLRGVCLHSGGMLFVAKEDGQAVGMAILQHRVYPLASVCDVLAIAGQPYGEWRDKMLDAIEEIAVLNDCKYVISEGRKGWSRLRKDIHHGSSRFYKEVIHD